MTLDYLPSYYGPCCILLAAVAGCYFKFLRGRTGHLLLCILTTALVYRRAILGYVLWIALPYATAVIIDRIILQHPRERLIRWRFSCSALLFFVAIFLANSWHGSPGAGIKLMGVTWTLASRDMWLILRIVTFMWEFGSNSVGRPDLVTYAIWITLPFTMQGPLLRLSEFTTQNQRPHRSGTTWGLFSKRWWLLLLLAAAQIGVGAVVNQLTPILSHTGVRWLKVFVTFGTGPWGFYLSTSGLFHLMECLACFWGLELPPSFDRPFGQPNLSDFWARWNMTVTRACRDYLFYNRWGLKKTNIYFNTLLLFLAIGVWHGTNLYWTLWGLLHGAGFCLFLWYRTHREHFSSLMTVTGSKRLRTLMAVTLTYVFVCSCWYLASKLALFIRQGVLMH